MAARRKAARLGKPKPPTDANALQRAKLALELHLAGHRWDDIARMAGYGSRGAAYNAVKRELMRQVKPPAEEVLAAEIERLNKLLTVFWPKALKGDGWSADRCLRISERRGRLLGLDFGAREVSAVNGHPNTYILGIPDDHPTDAPLPAMALPDGIPQPGPGDVVLAIPQSVVDAI